MMKMVYLLSAVILTSLLFSQYALATNEYYAGYGLKTDGDKFFQIIGSTRFNDSTVLPTKTQGAVISTTGTTNTVSPFTANGMVYQCCGT
ncbi:MAG: hypothetical protein HMLIMOIP_002528 [Candidatus Nitrosomirales archaeon]|jgi:hypothetical protein